MIYELSHTDVERIANRTAEILYWKLKKPTEKWTKSQREAFTKFGGESHVRGLLEEGKVAVRRKGRNIQYYVPDLEKYSTPEHIIKSKK
jgi:hypothetical protein